MDRWAGIRKLGLALGFAFALGLAAPLPALATPLQTAPAQGSCYGVHGRLVCNGHSVKRTWRYVCAYISRNVSGCWEIWSARIPRFSQAQEAACDGFRREPST